MIDTEKRESPQSLASQEHDGVTLDSYECQAASLSVTSPVLNSSAGQSCTEFNTRANLTIVGSFIALFCMFGQASAFGTYQSWYSAHQLRDTAPANISWIGSLQFSVFFFLGGITGRGFDAYGPFCLMASGTVLSLLSAIFTSFSTRYHQYMLSQGVLFGISVSLLYYPSIASVATYFSNHRATAVGLAATGSSAGGIVYPIVLQALFQKVGFAWAVRICGISSTLLCLVATFLVTSLPVRRKPGPIFVTGTIGDRRFIFLASGSCLVVLGLLIPYFYIIDYTKFITGNAREAFLALVVMNAAGVPGRLMPACLADAIGRFNLLTPCAFFAGLSCLTLWRVSYTLPLIFVFAATYGFFSGAFISIINPCVAQISEDHELGTRIGMLYTLISFPSLVGGPLGGVLLTKHQHSYQMMAIFSGSTLVAGSMLILCAKFAINGRLLAKV